MKTKARQKNEMRWLCDHSKQLEKFSGQWVLFSVNEGLVSKGKSLNAAMKAAHIKKGTKAPFIFHVPLKDELNP